METALIVFRQTVVMFIYMLAGYILFKKEKLTIKGSRDIANLLLWLIIPTVIVNSFCVERSAAKVAELLQSTLVGALTLLVAMAIAALVFKKHPIDNFGSAFSNAGFIGIPLVQAAIGDQAVFWIVGIIAMLNMLQWTYGVRVITGERSALKLKNILVNPILVGVMIGLMLFLSGAGGHLPDVINTTLHGISALNAPLAMIVLGSYMAQSDIKKTFTSGHLYVVSAVRLLLIPAATLAVFMLIPFRDDMLLALFISASAPIGANVAVYAQLHDLDYPYACQTVVQSTLLSIISLPLLLMLADVLI